MDNVIEGMRVGSIHNKTLSLYELCVRMTEHQSASFVTGNTLLSVCLSTSPLSLIGNGSVASYMSHM
jgi:hypothetical protein